MALPRTSRVYCLLMMGTALAAPLAAQVSGTITGTVRDASGAVIPNAVVTATHTQTSLTRAVPTDGTGQYVLTQLVVGTYEIRIVKDGFSPFMQTNVLLQANSQVQVEAVLQLPSAVEQVTVRSAPNLIQTNSSNLVQ